MAARTLVATTTALTGAAIVAASGTTASSDTMTISCSTAQTMLDLATLVIKVASVNSTTSVVLSLGAGDFSDGGIGAQSITLGTAASAVIGGQFFESARFLTDDDTLVFTHSSGAGPVSWEAYQAPIASE